MRTWLSILMVAVAVAACTPPEIEYCKSAGAAPNDMGACTQHYFQQEAAFNQDMMFCSAEADKTYPQSLYSGWGTALVHNHYRGGFASVEQVSVPPDYHRNQQVDALRMRIIDPCMQAQGWNSGRTWQAGRHEPAPRGKTRALPWHK